MKTLALAIYIWAALQTHARSWWIDLTATEADRAATECYNTGRGCPDECEPDPCCE